MVNTNGELKGMGKPKGKQSQTKIEDKKIPVLQI